MAEVLIPWFAGDPMESVNLTSRGEPLLISLALIAGGTGELIFDRRSTGLVALPVGVMMAISLLATVLIAMCYGAVKYASSDRVTGSQTKIPELAIIRIESISWWILIAAILISFGCVVLSELEP
ncbi:hypothetical protein [Umezawaea sp. NPDC059074]|uniref:hypothetical protein n=1 Tax=Umezawaea sp. NPDC059074 TaxID=3346716 RepID=UPI00369A0C69